MNFYSNQNFFKNKKFFKKYLKEFKKLIKNNPSLSNYKNKLKNDYFVSILNFTNSLIILNSDEKITENNSFKINYDVLLKSLLLLELIIIDNNNKNIFRYDLNTKINPYKIENQYDLNDEYFLRIKSSKDSIFLFIFSLYELRDWKIKFDEFYKIIFNIIILFYIKYSMFTIKKYFIFKKTIYQYTEYKTVKYLEVFKETRTLLQKYFPNFFNNLIYIINCQK